MSKSDLHVLTHVMFSVIRSHEFRTRSHHVTSLLKLKLFQKYSMKQFLEKIADLFFVPMLGEKLNKFIYKKRSFPAARTVAALQLGNGCSAS
jgi:hypothetical protein